MSWPAFKRESATTKQQNSPKMWQGLLFRSQISITLIYDSKPGPSRLATLPLVKNFAPREAPQKLMFLRDWRRERRSPSSPLKSALETHSRFPPLKRSPNRELRAVQKSRIMHRQSTPIKSIGYAVQKSGAERSAIRLFLPFGKGWLRSYLMPQLHNSASTRNSEPPRATTIHGFALKPRVQKIDSIWGLWHKRWVDVRRGLT